MGTSLAEQLQRYAVPQTDAIQRDKKRASLLFDPKKAAELRRETVYQIGLDGLNELITRNNAFEQFKETLFHITSRDFERSMQNEESNQKLDKNIRKFLLYLSPYFLLNCCHRSLEWLINRYSIHLYNREDLLMLAMPYHESNIFVRVIQLMKFKDSKDPWFFLKSLQKPGVHLTKSTLLNKAVNDVYFIKFASRYIFMLIKEHKDSSILNEAFHFYCTIFTGVIVFSKHVNENQIYQMLPSLLKGLNSDMPKFCATSYVIVTSLLHKVTLNDRILDKITLKIADLKVENLRRESVLVLLALYKSQKEYQRLPEEAFLKLYQREWIIRVLRDLSDAKICIYPLLERILRANFDVGFKNKKEDYNFFLYNLVEGLKLRDSFIGEFIRIMLEAAEKKIKLPKDHQTWLSQVLETIERQYPEPFDKAIYKIVSSSNNNQKKILKKILKHTLTLKGKFGIFDKLCNPNLVVREEAIEFLMTNFHSLRNSEKDMIRSLFVDKLNNDDLNIVEEALNTVKKTVIFDKLALNDVLINLFKKIWKNPNQDKLVTDIIITLCRNNESNNWEVFLAIFPFLLPNTRIDVKIAQKICQTSFICENKLLGNCVGKLKEVVDADEFCHLIFECLKTDNFDFIKECINDFIKIRKEKRDCLHKYLVMLILSYLLPENSTIEVSVLLIEIFVDFYHTSNIKVEKNKSDFHRHIQVAKNDKLHLDGFLLCLKNVIVKTRKPDMSLESRDFYETNDLNRFCNLITKILIKPDKIYRKYLKSYLEHFYTDNESKVKFIANLALSSDSILDEKFQLNCLDWICSQLQSNLVTSSILLNRNEIFLPNILLFCLKQSRTIRIKVIDILSELTPDKNSYYLLVQEILSQKEEILLDELQIPLVIFNLSPDNLKDNKNSKELQNIWDSLINVACTPSNPNYLKAGIFKLLSHVNTFDIFEKTSIVAYELLKTDNFDPYKSVIVTSNIVRFEPKISANIKLTSNVWKLMEETLKNDTIDLLYENKKVSPATLILDQLDREFFINLRNDIKIQVLNIIIEMATQTQNVDFLPAASRFFKHIDLDCDLILHNFNSMRDVQSSKVDSAKKKRRNLVPTIDILDTPQWRKGISVLEFIQDKKKITNTEKLVPVLFDVLKKCLDFDEQSALEYPKQLILSSILQCCSKLDANTIPKDVFNMGLIVQCIRASQNPQTHHHALLVLAYSAPLIPTQVLHHVMAIFIFMGSSVLRHDDAYSFQVISKIIDTIIPLLVQDGSTTTITRILRVFVDAILDIPDHRRLPLYKQLLEKIGVKEYLHLFLLLIFESHVVHDSHDKHKTVDSNSKRLEIAATICWKFEPEIIISTCINLVTYLKTLPHEKTDRERDDSDDSVIFSISRHTAKQLRYFTYTIVTFTAKLLSATQLIEEIADLNNDQTFDLEILYKTMIVNILTYIQEISKVAERNAATQQAEYWKRILHHSYDILDDVNALLTTKMFLLVIKGLMLHNFNTVKKRALELLNLKLQHSSSFFSDCSKADMYSLVPPIIAIIEGVNKDALETDEEVLIQIALLSLKLLVKYLVIDYPDKFVEILDFITNLIKSGKAHTNVLASVILCLSELCVNLRAKAISSLGNFMPALLKILKQQRQESPNLLLLTLLTGLLKILETLPMFLSPYLEKILIEVCLISVNFDLNDQKSQNFINKLSNIKQKIGTVIPVRILLPAIQQCYNYLLKKKSFEAIGALMNVLSENLSHLNGQEMTANLLELTDFFLNALQLRNDAKTSFAEVNLVEDYIIKALTVLILKLSESNFRPLYYKLFDWAIRNEKSERVITFYSLSNAIAECLRGLFVPFAGHFLNNAAEILDCCNVIKNESLYYEDNDKNTVLLENVLKTLKSVFSHDVQQFMNKDRFNILMQPLVDQLENTLGDINLLQKRNTDLITPCIVQFAIATADDALWKHLNYQILLKMRHTSAQIRLFSLHCLTEIVKKLGDEFLPLLPETIPFLSELLEDDDESVETACQKAVQEMEKVLGESLQKYF